MGDRILCVIPSVPVWKQGDNLVFDKKFFDGMGEYVRFWGGPVSVVMRLSLGSFPDFGKVFIKPNELSFQCTILAPDEHFQAAHFAGVSIVLAGGDAHNQLGLVPVVRQAGAKIVYIIEYIPETRYQIAALSTKNPVIRWRRYLYIWNQERRRRRTFSRADGLQSNGIPAAREYARFPENLLFFDTRVATHQYASDTDLENRLSILKERRPLRLAFSGRLITMKGADHLIVLAKILKQLKVDFRLTIYGTGDLDKELQSQVVASNLQSQVCLRGAVDFNNVLLPELISNCDLFVILHRQSDPSCTYMETLSCGVPIVGYANQAFQGLLDQAEVGWGQTLDDVEAVAGKIAHLDQHRDEIVEKARSGLAFARRHDFENTMRLRIAHLRRILQAAPTQNL